ncbi:MAG TPA: hypothetical protein VFU23_06710, partial [Gemmatimonadales bacterium]|nr:hypothetical protein [Gemmatimonadales bacterium]
MTREGRRNRIGPLAVAALAALVALPSLRNGFVYDDVPLIVQNDLVHRLGAWTRIWGSGYWPAGTLYRPLTIQLFNLEWILGGGRPIVFHAVSILLMAVTAWLVWRLAHRLLPSLPATIVAALFAVHPVHVESVAGVVGQSELLTAVFAMLAVERFMAWRARGTLGAGHRAALAVLSLLAISSKETGYVVPLLLGAAELTFFPAPRRAVARLFLLQGGAVVAGLLLRLSVLGGLTGETPSAALQGLSAGGRALGMLAVVPEWARLLFWPVRLQGEYGPPALSLTEAPVLVRLLGAVLVLLAAAVLYWGWRRQRVVAFAVLWIALSLLPVSNLLVATGLVLAERTLFLPSAGAMLAAGALVSVLLPRLGSAPKAARIVLAGAGLGLIVAAGAWSAARSTVWRSQEVFFARLVEEAPTTYRAQYVASLIHYGER